MIKIAAAQPSAIAPSKRPPRLLFRPANARRPFRRGDLALHAGSIVLVCMSEHDDGDANPELPIRSVRGMVGAARAKSLQLLAGVDTQEYGPGYHELLRLIADAGAAG